MLTHVTVLSIGLQHVGDAQGRELYSVRVISSFWVEEGGAALFLRSPCEDDALSPPTKSKRHGK